MLAHTYLSRYGGALSADAAVTKLGGMRGRLHLYHFILFFLLSLLPFFKKKGKRPSHLVLRCPRLYGGCAFVLLVHTCGLRPARIAGIVYAWSEKREREREKAGETRNIC